MSNKETLQNYNTNLEENNTTLSSILDTINNLPDGNVVVEGSIEITENGTYDVKQYAEAVVNITEIIEPVIEPDYITDGLVAWWEAEDELDSNNHWNSRVGSDYFMQKAAASGSYASNSFGYIKSDNAYKNNMNYSLTNTVDYYKQGYTIEVVGKINTQSNSTQNSTASMGVLFAFNKQASPMISICESTESFGCLNAYATQNMPKLFNNCLKKRYKYAICLDEIQDRSASSGYFTISYALNDSEWYQRNRHNVTNMSRNNGNCIILGYYTGEYLACGEINSIRVYNRKLNYAELKHNYEIDKARFNLDEYT